MSKDHHETVISDKRQFHFMTGTQGRPEDRLFTIMSDGSISPGPMFTTHDEMASLFWKTVVAMWPEFRREMEEEFRANLPKEVYRPSL